MKALRDCGSKKGRKPADKMDKTMSEWKQGELHSGSKKGPVVASKRQAVAIGLSQMRKAGQPAAAKVK